MTTTTLTDANNTATSSSSQPFTFTISVISDTVCPWCYIGKKTLDSAIASYTSRHPNTQFQLTWSPFMLYPRAPASGISKHRLLSKIYSSRAPQILTRLTSLGLEQSINFCWQGSTGNSRNSHRLILLSDSSPTVVETLFKYNFERGYDISDVATLARIGVELGLFGTERDGIEWFSSGDEMVEQVDDASSKAKARGMVASPSYVVNGRWQVGGMQEKKVWLEVLERVRSESDQDSGEEEEEAGK
ncbi:thioredoxin-like protein [Cladorrhinum sp. PSN332]|nr:thioredoxin-like protein [Cladorrhinum sp. PSN332]